jgi:hypothetical protein
MQKPRLQPIHPEDGANAYEATQEALADVDAGRVIDHQAVQAWADSLDTDKPLLPPHSRRLYP